MCRSQDRIVHTELALYWLFMYYFMFVCIYYMYVNGNTLFICSVYLDVALISQMALAKTLCTGTV